MAYWIIQTLIAIILFFAGYSDTDAEIYGPIASFCYYLIGSLSFILLSHFLLRAAANYLRKKEKSTTQIFFCILPLLVICMVIANGTKSLSSTLLFSEQKRIAFYEKYPDKSPKAQLARINEKLALIDEGKGYEIEAVKKKLAEYESQNLTEEELEIKRLAFEKGLRIGIEQAKREVGAKAGVESAENTQRVIRFSASFAFFLFWFLAYLPLSGLRRRLQVKNQLKESQIALLMSQLNPHFLFNSLNSIRGMIFEDKSLAKELIDKLNELFKYNLTANKHATVKLKEELRICEFYLDIEHIRLEERLLIEMHVDEQCLHHKVPTMGLLTLIENAIKHGIAPRQEQSLLVIEISKYNGKLTCKVTNPTYQGNYKVESTGTGQENLVKRLQLMYHDKASLVATHDGDKYVANLTIPA